MELKSRSSMAAAVASVVTAVREGAREGEADAASREESEGALYRGGGEKERAGSRASRAGRQWRRNSDTARAG